MKGVALLLSDQVVVPMSRAISAIGDVGNEVIGEKDVLTVSQASLLSKALFFLFDVIFIFVEKCSCHVEAVHHDCEFYYNLVLTLHFGIPSI